MLSIELSTTAQTAYAAVTSATRLDDVRSVAAVPGSFARKVVKGNEYWYYQTPDLTGKQMQIFLGSASPDLTRMIEQHRADIGVRAKLLRCETRAESGYSSENSVRFQ